MTLDLAKIKAAAERATPGPWTAEPMVGRGAWISSGENEWTALSCGNTDESARSNAAFIAAANPAATLALIARVERLEGALRKYGNECCEGLCEGNNEWANFEFDCGGCRARIAIRETD